MRQLLFLILTLLLFADCGQKSKVPVSSKTFEPCETVIEKDNKTITFIYPVCGDTSLYIKRTNSSDEYKKEECFKNGKLISLTTFYNFSKSELSYDESTYVNDSLFEIREHLLTPYNVNQKSFEVNDSIFFEIRYYANGNIARYSLTKRLCPFGRTVELDSLGIYKWIGNSSPTEKFDTIWEKGDTGDSTGIITKVCGLKTGKWTKFDRNNKPITSITYTDGRIENNR
jgi:hypothetical protein